ncbi:hypothetical protein RC84_19680 [Pectobacterium carotovorum subsp. carotovorum]|nr:hypothetical protein C1O30_08490 [Dickeya zeae]KHS78724.1 hypothetical protein RC84_19680 [Pectobacterium carotovorum subsp. carotovorum]
MGIISIITISVTLGLYTLYDSYSSYKKGVFKEYRKMAPFIYHYRKDKSFIPKILENLLLGLGMIGFAIWFWFKTS